MRIVLHENGLFEVAAVPDQPNTSHATLLRTLTGKSTLGFTAYADTPIQQLINLGKTRFLRTIYYTKSNINFSADVLKQIFITPEWEIDKPGTNPDRGEQLSNLLRSGSSLQHIKKMAHIKKADKQRRRADNLNYQQDDSKRFSRQNLTFANQGHVASIASLGKNVPVKAVNPLPEPPQTQKKYTGDYTIQNIPPNGHKFIITSPSAKKVVSWANSFDSFGNPILITYTPKGYQKILDILNQNNLQQGETIKETNLFMKNNPLLPDNNIMEKQLDEKATSKAQQQAAGIAHAVEKGELPKSKLFGASKQMFDSMSSKELDKFASTKHDGLPKHVDENLNEGYGDAPKDFNPNEAKAYKELQSALWKSITGVMGSKLNDQDIRIFDVLTEKEWNLVYPNLLRLAKSVIIATRGRIKGNSTEPPLEKTSSGQPIKYGTELNEKWDKDVDIKHTGENTDKTIGQLKKEKQSAHGKSEMGKLNFAIRAKQGFPKGEIKETEPKSTMEENIDTQTPTTTAKAEQNPVTAQGNVVVQEMPTGDSVFATKPMWKNMMEAMDVPSTPEPTEECSTPKKKKYRFTEEQVKMIKEIQVLKENMNKLENGKKLLF